MDTYEVAAIGDLYKKNLAGRKTWNLREFALTGVQMIYYKKGIKRGEWDISGCKVRRITPEEAQQPAAKYAFAIEGNKKQFMLSANNERNRELWINVLEKQIHEFRNPVRRFIRTGEIVHANGFVKKKNLFGKTPILLVVTNYPRIIEIDPATIELKEQYTWASTAPPSLTKLADTRFKINVGGKELRFEDPANGMPYWEALFARIHRIELWSPSKQPTLRIGFPGGAKSSATSPKSKEEEKKSSETKPETSKDLKFLEEALDHIQELLSTLNSKIEEIDLVFVLAVHDDDEVVEDNSQNAQERQLKRSQLIMLKENIDVIADNLKSLIQRSKQTGSALFDVTAIESVISEAATLLVLLNSDDEDEPEMRDPVINEADYFAGDVEDIDAMVALIDAEVSTMEEQIASTPAAESQVHENTRSSIIARVENARSSVTTRTEPVTDLNISPSTFDPSDSNKRPDGWSDVLMKRVLKREQQDREVGLDEDAILASREGKLSEEDALMCDEVAKYGQVQGLKSGGRKRAATLQQDVSSLDINPDNFDAPDPSKRPSFWPEVRTKRVMLKEHIDRINGTPESVIVDQRPLKEIEEEMVMVGEVLAFTRLLNISENKNANAERAKLDVSGLPSRKPSGWAAALTLRVQYKDLEDRLNGEEESHIAAKRAVREKEEDEDMLNEASTTGGVTILGTRTSQRKVVEKVTQQEEAMALVVDEENVVDAEELPTQQLVRDVPEIEEPVQYQDATITFGSMTISSHDEVEETPVVAPVTVHAAAAPKAAVAKTAPVPKAVSSKYKEFGEPWDPNSSQRPPGWAEMKLRRVYLKEWQDRKDGVDEDEILERRYQRELEAEQEMLAELGVKGKIALFEKGIRKPVKKTAKAKAREEFAAFMAQSQSSIASLNQKFAQIEVK